MVNVKITDLNELTTPSASDLFAIEDLDAVETKKITYSNIISSASFTVSQVSDFPTTISVAQADAIIANTAKVSFDWDYDYNDLINSPTTITTSQANAIIANTAKVSFDWDYDYNDLINAPTTITVGQASAITTNTAKISFDSTSSTKLGTIEEGADVTDAANVAAAGALMDSEVDADIKTLTLPANTTISAYGASLVDDVDAATARSTLDVDVSGTDNSDDNAVNTTYEDDYRASNFVAGTDYQVPLVAGTDYLTSSAIAASYQPLASVLTNTTASFTTALASNISDNNAKISFTWDYDYADLINSPTTISVAQANAIVANTAKVSFTWDYDYADLINTPTTITAQQISDITSNNSFRTTPSTVITAGTNCSWSGNTLNVSSGTSTDTNAIHDNVANEISALTEKTTPADDDLVLIEDSAASYVKKKVKISALSSGGSGAAATFERTYTGAVSTGRLLPIIIPDELVGLDIKEVRLSLLALPTGSALKVDLRKSGTATTDSIFTSDTEINILTTQTATNGVYQAGCDTSGSTVGTPSTTLDSARTTLAADDVLWIYITTIGSTLAGTDLTVTISVA